MEENCYNLINKLYFERICGTSAEKKAKNIIKESCKTLGVEAIEEDFNIQKYKSHKCSLQFQGLDFEPYAVFAGGSASTPEEGIEKDFVYISCITQANMLDLQDKICLFHQRYLNDKLLKKFKESKIAGLILSSGSIYDTNFEISSNLYDIQDYSEFPVVYIPIKQANEIVKANVNKVKMISVQTEETKQSSNVIAEIKGMQKPEEIIVFTAHYDTVPFSKGAYDNASGCAMIMDIMQYFLKNRTDRTLRFIWCGSEEIGLKGSEHYVKEHEKELKNIRLCVNIDMAALALGIDCAEVTAEKELTNYISYLGCEKGFPIEVSQKIYSSDSNSFADKGIPAVSFIRRSFNGGAQIHNKNDILESLSEKSYNNTYKFIIQFIERMTNSIYFPIKREMPKEMKDELDKYYKRDKKENSL